jgi:hypothetical protein
VDIICGILVIQPIIQGFIVKAELFTTLIGTHCMLIKGKWPEETHEDKHKRLFDNLVSLLADLENAAKADSVVLPLQASGEVDWSKISVNFLTQWSLINCQKISHTHKE